MQLDFLHPAPPLPPFIETRFSAQRRMASVSGFNVHFVDEGTGPAVFLMHGNPAWSFLWRNVIKGLPGYRVIAPDLPGLGLSDKPKRVRDHSLERNIETLTALVRGLDLGPITFVGQDWGGPVAAGVAAALPEQVEGLVFANTAVTRPKRPFRTTSFHRFSHMPVVSDLAFRGLNFPVPIMHRVQGDRSSIAGSVADAYAWPLRRPWDRAAPLALARMVPNHANHPSTAPLDRIADYLESYEGPAGLVWGLKDPILGRVLNRHRRLFPQASVREAPNAGHFLQEEVPELLVDAIREVRPR